MNIVYGELISAMARRKVSRASVARGLNISVRSLYSKLHGETDFTLSEANAIHAMFFPDMDKDKLFSTRPM